MLLETPQSHCQTPSTGEPDAGKPPVRFGGRGDINTVVPTPIHQNVPPGQSEVSPYQSYSSEDFFEALFVPLLLELPLLFDASPFEFSSLEPLYAALPARFPPLFERLVLTYRWAEADLQSYGLLANPPGLGLGGLLQQMSKDSIIWKFLSEAGFIQLGKALTSTTIRYASI